METDTKPAPPRVLSVPQTPVPQTCFGVLNEMGQTLDSQQIMDFPPDFSWMSSMEIYIDAFRFPKVSNVADTRKELWKSMVLDYNPGVTGEEPRHSLGQGLKTWHMIPFMTSKWWTGVVKYRFMAIKPERVTGKLLLTYYPDGALNQGSPLPVDTLRRSIKKEWDLGQSSDFEFEISAFNVIEARPTWIPRFSFADSMILLDQQRISRFCTWSVPIPSYNLGVIQIEEAQELQPGSIFPDSIRILVFMSVQDAEFAVQCDPRSNKTHIFAGKRAHNVNVGEVRNYF
nr:MAG: putative capsid protein 2 [Polycipiviridae sp.]